MKHIQYIHTIPTYVRRCNTYLQYVATNSGGVGSSASTIAPAVRESS